MKQIKQMGVIELEEEIEELKRFDDNRYYTNESGDGGVKAFAYIIVCSAISVAAFLHQSWWMAAPAVILFFFQLIQRKKLQAQYKLTRLRRRAIAAHHPGYEEAMV